MAIQKVTYEDKVDLKIWASIPNTNKIKADDMNEIKGAINENADELSSAKDMVASQDSEIEALMNALPSESKEDENINIKGTIPVKFKEFKLSGNSKQETSDAMPSPEFPSPIQNVEGDVNVTVANKEKTEQQTVTFPLSEGQKLMQGDYLADDGIHHARKQVVLNGSESGWSKRYSSIIAGIAQYTYNLKHLNTTGISNYFKPINGDTAYYGVGINFNNSTTYIRVNFPESVIPNYTQEELKQWLSTHNLIVEYELAEEEIEAYTPEQQEAYNQICNLKAYEEETNVYSTNSTSPIFKVTAVQSTNAMLTKMKQLILEGGN